MADLIEFQFHWKGVKWDRNQRLLCTADVQLFPDSVARRGANSAASVIGIQIQFVIEIKARIWLAST